MDESREEEQGRQSGEREAREQCEKRTKRREEGLTEESVETKRTDKKGEETESMRKRRRAVQMEETGGEQTLEVHIGTMNISGISYGYRGKYMKTEEE
eukprot:3301832-Pleurochrysis_carterae.AAC.1